LKWRPDDTFAGAKPRFLIRTGVLGKGRFSADSKSGPVLSEISGRVGGLRSERVDPVLPFEIMEIVLQSGFGNDPGRIFVNLLKLGLVWHGLCTAL
jgi:hypothetical protein